MSGTKHQSHTDAAANVDVANLQDIIAEYQLLVTSSRGQVWGRNSMATFVEFLQNAGFTEINLTNYLLFMAFLVSERYAPLTIMGYKESLKLPLMSYGLDDFGGKPQATAFFKGLKKVTKLAEPTRKPVTINMLSKLIEGLYFTTPNQFYLFLYRAMFTVAFHGLTRINEISRPIPSLHTAMINREEMRQEKDTIFLFVNNAKTATDGQKQPIRLDTTNDHTCPVVNLCNYLTISSQKTGPLFLDPKGDQIDRKKFAAQLQITLDFIGEKNSAVTSHSFCIGGATYLAEQNQKLEVSHDQRQVDQQCNLRLHKNRWIQRQT